MTKEDIIWLLLRGRGLELAFWMRCLISSTVFFHFHLCFWVHELSDFIIIVFGGFFSSISGLCRTRMHGVVVRKYLHFIPAFSLVFVFTFSSDLFIIMLLFDIWPSKTKHTSDNQAQGERTLRATIPGLWARHGSQMQDHQAVPHICILSNNEGSAGGLKGFTCLFFFFFSNR